MIETRKQARDIINKSINVIEKECKLVLASELHYQAIIYHCLRQYGKIPISQIGMNVKISINNPYTEFLKDGIKKKNINYQKGKEIIPDISIFTSNINSDFRRRNNINTLKETLYSLEVKASERKNGRLRPKEIKTDILKLNAQFEETRKRYNKQIGIGVIVIDTAPNKNERMTEKALIDVIEFAHENNVDFWYCS